MRFSYIFHDPQIPQRRYAPLFNKMLTLYFIISLMSAQICTLDKLKPGESGSIVSFNDEEKALKFMEMGCTPGELVLMDSYAPLGDPIAVIVSGYKLSLRKSEAAYINIERIK